MGSMRTGPDAFETIEKLFRPELNGPGFFLSEKPGSIKKNVDNGSAFIRQATI